MEKNPPKKTMIDLQLENLAQEATPSCRHCHGRGHEGYNTKKDAHILCRCVKRNRRANQDVEAAVDEPGSEPRPFNGFNEIQIGTIRRMREEADLLDEKARKAVVEVGSHSLQAKVSAARVAAEEEQKSITAKVNTAREQRDLAVKEEGNVERCKRLIEGYKREANQSKARHVELTREADRLESDAAKAETTSRSQGLQRALTQIEKRFSQQTHSIAKKGREAAKRADRIRGHLESTYPGHEQVS